MNVSNLERRRFLKLASLTTASIALSQSSFGLLAKPIFAGKRIGIIGLDTSHSVAFAKAINAKDAGNEYLGYKVVAAYPKGSNDIKTSVERIPKYTEEIKTYGVEIVNSIEALIKKVDFVCLETNDGRLHLEQALPVLKARKPMFIDKPMAASLKDAIAIFAASEKYKTPVFSSSSLRYITGMQDVLDGKAGKIIGAETYSPAKLEETHPDFFWYGIHGVETLFTAMGPDCESVVRVNTPDTDVIVGKWSDGRIGSVRGTRSGKADYGGIVYGEKANVVLGSYAGYTPLLKEIVNFFETKIPPVKKEETLAILAFMEAADESKKLNGKPVSMKTIYERSRYKK